MAVGLPMAYSEYVELNWTEVPASVLVEEINSMIEDASDGNGEVTVVVE